MTTRLALSMLATVWAILIASGITAYVTTRSVLIANMDGALVMQATSLKQSTGFVVQSGNQIVDSSMKTHAIGLARPKLLESKFVTADDGTRVRSARIEVSSRNEAGEVVKEVVIQRESADALDRLLNQLAMALLGSGCAGGVIAAFVARVVAKITLRPLRSTAETIGAIDEQNLARRIDASKLAPELLPVAQKLNEMLERLEESFENRKQFLADASHELRTPVAAMVTTLEVSLRRLRDAESYRETMQTCLADARLLRILVDALMKQARSEIGAFKEEAVPTDVSTLLHEAVSILTAMADQKSITLSAAIEDSILVEIAPGRLKQAVMGLLENAIDHNRSGGTVELSAVLNGDQLQISIRDTGPGIAAEHLPRIFEPFYRVSQARDASGHMGLGLYLVKTHIDALKGTLSVKSQLGEGTTFGIRLTPAKVAQKPMVAVVAG